MATPFCVLVLVIAIAQVFDNNFPEGVEVG
jgi:hypothetical protein